MQLQNKKKSLSAPTLPGTTLLNDEMTSDDSSMDELNDNAVHDSSSSSTRPLHSSRRHALLAWLLPWTGALVWPLMLTVPLLLTSAYSPTSYQQLFAASWYEYDNLTTPKPLGLILGILAVGVGQVFLCGFFYLYKYGYLSSGHEPRAIQTKGARSYEFREGLKTHVSQPEGFIILVTYLSVTWMFHLMPASYYSFQGGICIWQTAACLILQDAIQYVMHVLEHVVSPAFYQHSHKPHHRFVNPRLFDAFNGSLIDTISMIVIPLFITANVMRHVNVWTYMAFGSVYAGWLTLIHSEYRFVWDAAFSSCGLGTPGDHHVHHKFFKYNYGHLFMWWDQWAGTYRNPQEFAPRVFNP